MRRMGRATGISVGMRMGGRKAAGGPSLYVQVFYSVGASNTAGGDDSAGAALAAADEDSRLRFWNPNTGNLITLSNAVGIPRPGAMNLTATTPLINYCKGLADANPNTIYVIAPTAVGGRALNGGLFDPDGAGPAWTIGGTPEATLIAGAMYLAYTNGTIPNSVNAEATHEIASDLLEMLK